MIAREVLARLARFERATPGFGGPPFLCSNGEPAENTARFECGGVAVPLRSRRFNGNGCVTRNETPAHLLADLASLAAGLDDGGAILLGVSP